MSICRKISKYIGLFNIIRRIATTKILLLLYYALLYPHLQYSVTNWSCACKTILAPLQVTQNKILRGISHTKVKQSVFPEYKEMKILMLNDILRIELAELCLNSKTNYYQKTSILFFLVSIFVIHKYNTRRNQSDIKFYQEKDILLDSKNL